MGRKPTSFRLAEETVALIFMLEESLGLSKTAVIDMAIRDLAKQNTKQILDLRKTIKNLSTVSAGTLMALIDWDKYHREEAQMAREYLEAYIVEGKVPIPGFKPTISEVT